MLNDSHTFEPDTDTCEVCHTDIGRDFDYRGVQTEISELVEGLKDLLLVAGLVEEDDGEVDPIAQTTSSAKAGVVLNFFMIAEDKGGGVHNPKYVKALLKNSIEFLQ